jgi:putative transposase
MPRLSRIVIPDVPHHVTQRGNRRMPVFFSDDDRREYLRLVAGAAAASGTRCLAWCLMDNHVHLILVPPDPDGLRATLGEAHRRYTSRVNLREGWRGHLFQGRFASYPMDKAHAMAAVRYVENNPVAAGSVMRAEQWRWSSARSHIAGERVADDPLTDIEALADAAPDWRSMLQRGLEAGALSEEGKPLADAIEARLRTGRPLAADAWIERQEQALGRRLRPRKRGRKRRVSIPPAPPIRGQYT